MGRLSNIILNHPLTTTDGTDKQLFTDQIHETEVCYAINDNTGMFLAPNSVIISAGGTSIVIGNGEVYINGKVVQNQMVENTTRGLMTNPLGFLPGTLIPITIPAAFNKFPDPAMILPFLSLGTQLAQVAVSFGGL